VLQGGTQVLVANTPRTSSKDILVTGPSSFRGHRAAGRQGDSHSWLDRLDGLVAGVNAPMSGMVDAPMS
jgi:hypothetical protein